MRLARRGQSGVGLALQPEHGRLREQRQPHLTLVPALAGQRERRGVVLQRPRLVAPRRVNGAGGEQRLCMPALVAHGLPQRHTLRVPLERAIAFTQARIRLADGLQGKGFAALAAALPPEPERFFEQVERALGLADIGMDHTQVVHGVGDGLHGAKAPANGEGCFIVRNRPPRLTEVAIQDAEIAHRLAASGLVFDGLPDGERRLVRVARLIDIPQAGVGYRAHVEGVGFGAPVTASAGVAERPLEKRRGPRVLTARGVEPSQLHQRFRLPRLVCEAPRRS